MDLRDQLRDLFPDHIPENEEEPSEINHGLWIQEEPILCKYEKRKGKPVTILEGYKGTDADLKNLAKLLKSKLSVGGSAKQELILIQGDYRDRIMVILRELGFKTKRVGG